MKKKTEKLIGHHILRRPDANEFALTLFPNDKCNAIAVSVYKTHKNPYGFRVQTEDYMEGWHRVMYDVRTSNKKSTKKVLKNLKSDKPVDTSKWVKPDEESINHASIEAMIMLELCKKDSNEEAYWKGREEALYSVLHCTASKNPQGLYDMSHGDNLESVMYALRTNKKKHFGYWALYRKIIMPKEKKKIIKSEDWEKLRLEYKLWKASVRKDLFSVYIWSRKSPGFKRMKAMYAKWAKEYEEKGYSKKQAKEAVGSIAESKDL